LTSVANLPPVSTTLLKLVAKFAAGVVDHGDNLPLVSLTPVANLPTVSTTLLKLVAKFAAGVFDTGGKFATGVLDTPLTTVANLPPVLSTPVVNLELRISP
jgi:hypothetical protein